MWLNPMILRYFYDFLHLFFPQEGKCRGKLKGPLWMLDIGLGVTLDDCTHHIRNLSLNYPNPDGPKEGLSDFSS